MEGEEGTITLLCIIWKGQVNSDCIGICVKVNFQVNLFTCICSIVLWNYFFFKKEVIMKACLCGVNLLVPSLGIWLNKLKKKSYTRRHIQLIYCVNNSRKVKSLTRKYIFMDLQSKEFLFHFKVSRIRYLFCFSLKIWETCKNYNIIVCSLLLLLLLVFFFNFKYKKRN